MAAPAPDGFFESDDPDAYLEDAAAIAKGHSNLPVRRVHLVALLRELERKELQVYELIDINEALIVALSERLRPDITEPPARPARPN